LLPCQDFSDEFCVADKYSFFMDAGRGHLAPDIGFYCNSRAGIVVTTNMYSQVRGVTRLN
jgi:hypothetical protein